MSAKPVKATRARHGTMKQLTSHRTIVGVSDSAAVTGATATRYHALTHDSLVVAAQADAAVRSFEPKHKLARAILKDRLRLRQAITFPSFPGPCSGDAKDKVSAPFNDMPTCPASVYALADHNRLLSAQVCA
jgi:hypothetical protein